MPTFEGLPDKVHQAILDTIDCPKCLNNLISASPSSLRVLQLHRRATLWRLAQRTIPVSIHEKLQKIRHLDVDIRLIEKLLKIFRRSLVESTRHLRTVKHRPSNLGPSLLRYFGPAEIFPRQDVIRGNYCNTGCSRTSFDRSVPCVAQIALEVILPELWLRPRSTSRLCWDLIRSAGSVLEWTSNMPWTPVEQAMVQTSITPKVISKPWMHHIDCPVHLSVASRVVDEDWNGYDQFSLFFAAILPNEPTETVEQ